MELVYIPIMFHRFLSGSVRFCLLLSGSVRFCLVLTDCIRLGLVLRPGPPVCLTALVLFHWSLTPPGAGGSGGVHRSGRSDRDGALPGPGPGSAALKSGSDAWISVTPSSQTDRLFWCFFVFPRSLIFL